MAREFGSRSGLCLIPTIHENPQYGRNFHKSRFDNSRINLNRFRKPQFIQDSTNWSMASKMGRWPESSGAVPACVSYRRSTKIPNMGEISIKVVSIIQE